MAAGKATAGLPRIRYRNRVLLLLLLLLLHLAGSRVAWDPMDQTTQASPPAPAALVLGCGGGMGSARCAQHSTGNSSTWRACSCPSCIGGGGTATSPRTSQLRTPVRQTRLVPHSLLGMGPRSLEKWCEWQLQLPAPAPQSAKAGRHGSAESPSTDKRCRYGG